MITSFEHYLLITDFPIDADTETTLNRNSVNRNHP